MSLQTSQIPDSFSGFCGVEGCQFCKGWKNYGVPYDSNTVIACYRTDYLEQAGYSIEDLTDITWDEFIVIGEDVLAKTGMPMLTNAQGRTRFIEYDSSISGYFCV